MGLHGKSALLDKLGFGDFNKPFRPARTDLDWLSRDEAEVDADKPPPVDTAPFPAVFFNVSLLITTALSEDGC